MIKWLVYRMRNWLFYLSAVQNIPKYRRNYSWRALRSVNVAHCFSSQSKKLGDSTSVLRFTNRKANLRVRKTYQFNYQQFTTGVSKLNNHFLREFSVLTLTFSLASFYATKIERFWGITHMRVSNRVMVLWPPSWYKNKQNVKKIS